MRRTSLAWRKERERRYQLQAEHLGDHKPVNRLQPLVSVCVATYQHGNFIAQCLDGVLMQKTTFLYEIIVGEDESTDATREICIDYAERNPDKIRLFLRSRTLSIWNDSGRTRRFNGIWCRQSARGKYVAICEGDDYWTDPEKLQRQIDYLEAHPECALCFHNVRYEDSTGYYQGKATYAHNKKRLPLDRDATFTIVDTLPGGLIPTCSVVMRNAADIRNPPELFYTTLTGDWLLWLLASGDKEMFYFHKPMAVYRVTNLGMSHNLRKDPNAIYRDRIRTLLALDRHWNYRLHTTLQPTLHSYFHQLPYNYSTLQEFIRYLSLQPREATKFAIDSSSEKACEGIENSKAYFRRIASKLFRPLRRGGSVQKSDANNVSVDYHSKRPD